MNIKNRLKRLETVILAEKAKDEIYSITLDGWRRSAKGEDILLELSERAAGGIFRMAEASQRTTTTSRKNGCLVCRLKQ